MTTTLRARFDGTALIPVGPVNLPVGTELDVEVRTRPGSDVGSPAALLAAMASPPHLEPGDAEVLERAIEERKSPIRSAGPFDEMSGL